LRVVVLPVFIVGKGLVGAVRGQQFAIIGFPLSMLRERLKKFLLLQLVLRFLVVVNRRLLKENLNRLILVKSQNQRCRLLLQ
jgi:hypothetical protein